MGEELKQYVTQALPRDSGDYLLDIYINLYNSVESLDSKPTFAKLKETYARDSTFSFPPVIISIIHKSEPLQSIEPILDRCIGLVQDKALGTYTELGCFFVSSEKYDELKQNQNNSPEFLYNYLWPAYKKREFPAFYIHSGQPKNILLKRKQNILQ